MGNNLVPRNLFPAVAGHLVEKEITVIAGARQVGKTTLLKQLKEYLIERKREKEENIKIFNLDLVTDMELFASQKDFIRYLEAEVEAEKKIYVFVDEVQRIKNPGQFFKGIYDLGLPVKMVLTGSSSLEIKAKVQEPLTGRKRLFHLYPFSFDEYLAGRHPSLLKFLKIKEPDNYHLNQILEALSEYLIFGGYPRVILEKRGDQKVQLLKEIYSSYIEKDIVGFLKIAEALNFSKLVSLLGGQVGQLVNSAEIGNTLGMKQETIQAYLRIMEQTYVTQLVRPFFRNIRKELTKMPKIYFWDNGIRNFSLESFRSFDRREDRGQLLENFVFAQMASADESKVRYWRTKDKSEVDFVYESRGEIIPVEVKAQKLKQPEIPRSLMNFINRYRPTRAYIVNLGLRRHIKIGKTNIYYLYPYQIKTELK